MSSSNLVEATEECIALSCLRPSIHKPNRDTWSASAATQRYFARKSQSNRIHVMDHFAGVWRWREEVIEAKERVGEPRDQASQQY